MANFVGFSPAMSPSTSDILDIQTIWQMGLQYNNRVLVPERVADTLNDAQINELKSRLR